MDLTQTALGGLLGVHDNGRGRLVNDVLVDEDLANVRLRRDLVHDVEHRRLEDRAQAAGAALVAERVLRDLLQRALGELHLDAVHLEELLVLLDEGVLRLGEDVDQRLFVELVERRDHRQAADELGDHAVLEEILGLNLLEEVPHPTVLLGDHLRAEPDGLLADAVLDDVLEPGERAAADEEDVRGVNLEELLLRVLAAALGRNARDRALDDLEERLLHALARHVARDRRVVGLAGDLVDLVDVDDAALRLLDVVIGVLEEVDDDVLDVLADVAGLGEVGGVGDGEGDVQDARQRLREEGLAAAGRAEQEDVRLLQLDVVGADLGVDALVVVVDRDGEDLLGALLADHVLVEHVLDLGRLGHAGEAVALLLLLDLLGDDVVAEPDALVADVHGGPGDELLHLLLGLATEGA